jgi:hypothetical protein
MWEGRVRKQKKRRFQRPKIHISERSRRKRVIMALHDCDQVTDPATTILIAALCLEDA